MSNMCVHHCFKKFSLAGTDWYVRHVRSGNKAAMAIFKPTILLDWDLYLGKGHGFQGWHKCLLA
uniref:Uncharacterized protein n=1 Tax=Rhizophora mucronata TaxID=61149 RepID=A0A2P2Q1J5_RHIMU